MDVRNSSLNDKNYYLELARPLTNIVQLYIFDEEGELKQEILTGDDFKFSDRPYENRKFIFPLEFPAQSSQTIIVRTKSDGEILKLPLKLWEVDAFTQAVSQENFFIGIYYGIFILVIVLFSLIGFASREKLYVFFVAYVMCLALFQFSLDGFAYQYLWRGSPWMGNHAVLIFAALSMLGMYLYVQQFLGIRSFNRRYKVGFNLFIALLGVSLLMSMSSGTLYAITFPLLNGLSFLAVIYILIGIVIKGRREKKIEIPVLLAFLALVLSSILFILTNVDIIHSEFLASNALKIGSGTELIFLSIAMAGRYRQTQIEKIKAQDQAVKRLEELNTLKSQQTEKLEEEVRVRTQEIQLKNDQLSHKNEEILNSINYARRLQNAILPTLEDLNSSLPSAAVFYRPKDIISGDFYWLHESDTHVYLAVADCTGHGVPGAMLSVLGHNSLNRCVNEFGLQDPGELLDKLRELIIDAFDSEKIKVDDGMDITLAVWDKKNHLRIAGAHNPLYLIRNGSLESIDTDRQPVGRYRTYNPFTTSELELAAGDTIILFSDGYKDQFGGPQGRKFKSGRFKKLLLSLEDTEISEWEHVLSREIDDWMQDTEQIDDMCVLAVRF